MSLTGKVAIVTGSSRSIGAETAIALGAQGCNVIVTYNGSESAAHEVVSRIQASGSGSKATAVRANLSRRSDGEALVQSAVDTFGRLDILVLNAGIMGSRALADVDDEFWDEHFDTNVKVPLFMVRKALPHLQHDGRIIFLSSSLTMSSNVQPANLTYVATKGAIEQASRALAKDLGARGITSNVISPGPCDTPLFRAGKPEGAINFIASLAPANRLGTASDIAPVIQFLASPDSRWVNGTNIPVNGGFAV